MERRVGANPIRIVVIVFFLFLEPFGSIFNTMKNGISAFLKRGVSIMDKAHIMKKTGIADLQSGTVSLAAWIRQEAP